jgi:hypothetical protein
MGRRSDCLKNDRGIALWWTTKAQAGVVVRYSVKQDLLAYLAGVFVCPEHGGLNGRSASLSVFSDALQFRYVISFSQNVRIRISPAIPTLFHDNYVRISDDLTILECRPT